MTSMREANAFALAQTSAARTIEADRVHFVDIGQCVVSFGKRDDFADRREVAVHRVEALEHDELGAVERFGGEQLFEMGDVVVAPQFLFAARALHALDHRIVVQGVGEDQAIGQKARDRRNRREIGYPARGEGERRLFAMQVGELGLELDDRIVRAGDVAGSPCACAMGARPR